MIGGKFPAATLLRVRSWGFPLKIKFMKHLITFLLVLALLVCQSPAAEVRSTAVEFSHVLLAKPGRINRLDYFNPGGAQFILLIDAISLPSNGAVTLLYPPIPVGAAASGSIQFPRGLSASTGIVVASSSTGTFTLTLGNGIVIYAVTE